MPFSVIHYKFTVPTPIFIILLQIKNDLREMSQEELSAFIEEFNCGIFEMVSSNDVSEKQGGILAISE